MYMYCLALAIDPILVRASAQRDTSIKLTSKYVIGLFAHK